VGAFRPGERFVAFQSGLRGLCLVRLNPAVAGCFRAKLAHHWPMDFAGPRSRRSHQGEKPPAVGATASSASST
jgi:hypothetical protein